MVFEKNGQRLVVNDRTHIDCLKAKGWVEVVEQAEESEKESGEEQAAATEEVKANARKTPRRTE